MIRNIPVEERRELSGYDDGDLEKVQACLAEVISRRPFLTRPFLVIELFSLTLAFSGSGPSERLSGLVQK